jgi:hypothetical protein
MAWSESGAKPREIKFLVDLEKHTYISDKSHQEIIDLAHLNPAGYDNYLKGWVKRDGTIKLWVETIEDLAFRYWDQIKLALKQLIKEDLTSQQAKTFAIVNRVERFAGVVRDFLALASKNRYFEDKLGYVVHFSGQPKLAKGSEVLLLVNLKVADNRYVLTGARGKVLVSAGSQAKRLRIKWKSTTNGIMRPQSGLEMLVDRRLVAQV